MFRRYAQIPVDVKLDGEVYVATSPLVKGFIVVNKSRDALFEGVEQAMRDLTDYNLQQWDLQQPEQK
jgi:hypothetical protein